jgi:putative transcriptional regulator
MLKYSFALEQATAGEIPSLGSDSIEVALKRLVGRRKGALAAPVTPNIPDELDVKSIRAKTGMSQREFARAFCINPRSLQEWERGRRRPENAVRAYLTIISRDPETVRQALAQGT